MQNFDTYLDLNDEWTPKHCDACQSCLTCWIDGSICKETVLSIKKKSRARIPLPKNTFPMNTTERIPQTEDTPDIYNHLLSQGWKEGEDGFRKYTRMFYKRHATPTRCNLNNNKDGMSVLIYVSDFTGYTSYEIELSGELRDGTWIKLSEWALPRDIRLGLLLIPRLLHTWEVIANAD